MEVHPGRPWLTPDPDRPVALDAERSGWWTGTVEDQFTPIYLALARPVVGLHGPIAPDQVDRMSLVTVWALMGVGEAAKQTQRTMAQYGGGVPAGGMVPKSVSGVEPVPVVKAEG